MTNAPLRARGPLDHARPVRRRRVATAIAAASLLLLGIGSVAAAAAAQPDEALAPAVSGALSLPVGGSLAAWTLMARARLHGASERARCAVSLRSRAAASSDTSRNANREGAISEVVSRFYSTCSGSAFERRWAEFAALFEPGGRLVQVDRDGSTPAVELSVSEFIALARTSVHARRFDERRRVVHVVGALAVVLSEFDAVDPEMPGHSQGVNCFELRERDGAWRIGRVLCAASVASSATDVS